nr:hypothetical protein [uncultured Duganella sp.]
MKMVYHVFHDYEAAKQSIDALMYSFDAEREEHEYSCFPDTLVYRNRSADVSMSAERAKGERGLHVTVDSPLAEDVMIAALADVLVRQNRDIKGLCLVANRIG